MSLREISRLLEIVAAKPLLGRKDLAARYSRTLATIDRWHKRGTLPPAIYLKGCRVPLWSVAALAAWERQTRRKKSLNDQADR